MISSDDGSFIRMLAQIIVFGGEFDHGTELFPIYWIELLGRVEYERVVQHRDFSRSCHKLHDLNDS